MITALMIAVIVLADSAHDVLLTKGMKQVGEVSTIKPRELLLYARKVVSNKNFIVGFLFTILYFLSFVAVLSWADLSFVFPATSLVYVTGTFGARFILGEKVGFQRWTGILLVCAGVALTSLQ
jgi:transporter family protein